MKLKVCFNNETHRISKVPENFESLIKLLSSIFLTSLPSNYSLEYIDADGDKIMLADEQDFKEFISSEMTNKTGNSVVKLFIVPTKSVNQSQILSVASLSESALKKRQSEEEEYQVIEGLKNSGSKIETSSTEEPVKPAVEDLVKEPELKELPEEKQVVPEESLKEELLNKTEVEEVKEPELVLQNEVPVETKTEEKSLPVDNKPKANNAPKKAPKQKAPKVKKTSVKINGQDLEDLVTKAVEKNLAKIASMTQAFLQPKAQSTSQTEARDQPPAPAVHRGVRCDGCHVYPIVGIRYKCSVLPDFDFCELCEQTKEHQYAFIKIKFPGHVFSHQARMPHPCQMMRVPGMPFMGMGPRCPVRRANNVEAPTEQANNVSQPVQPVQPVQPTPVVKETVVLKKEVEEKPKVEVQVEEKIKIEEPEEVKPEPESKPVTIEDETDKVFKDGKRIVPATLYSQKVVTKAVKLKQRLPTVNLDELLSFVDRAPEDLSLDELLENFRY